MKEIAQTGIKKNILIFTLIQTVFSCTVADIVIQKTDNQTYKTGTCGKNLTLTCLFQKNTIAVKWMKPNDNTAIAQCLLKSCDLNPAYVWKYSIASDVTQGIFNLTIINVAGNDSGRTLVCSDGSQTDFITIRVRDYNPQLFKDAQSGTINAISGCVAQDTEVSFKWIKISYSKNSRMEEEITPKNILSKSTSCFNDSDCGYDQHVQYTEIVSVESSSGGQYYYKIVAVYGNESKESDIIGGKYMIESKEENSNIENNRHVSWVDTIPIIGCLVGIVLIVFLLNLVYRNRKLKISFSVRSSSTSTSSNKQLVQNESETCEIGHYSDVDKPDGTNDVQFTMSDNICAKLKTYYEESHMTNSQEFSNRKRKKKKKKKDGQTRQVSSNVTSQISNLHL